MMNKRNPKRNTKYFVFLRKFKKTYSWDHQFSSVTQTPEKQLNEAEIGKLPEKEFRIMTVKMIQDLRKRMDGI